LNQAALYSLHRYNDYANGLVFDAAGNLSDEDLQKSSSPSHGTVKMLLIHMLGTETHFLSACLGCDLDLPVSRDNPPLEAIREGFGEISRKRMNFLDGTKEEDITEVIPVEIGPGIVNLPRWQMLAQSLLHSAHHRGELSIVMTGLGQPLPTLDPILQFVKESGQEWPLK
jgi:uncharacterized damage-inducible protein DinB